MSIKAIIPEGLTEITVNGLHQWDYGQQLEVTCEGLPPLVEVHFACSGMSEAVVRSCYVSTQGVFTAAIPDRCLEQATPIYAWVVDIGASSGTTVLKITMPIIERTRPEAGNSVPETISDKYTESIAAINAQVESLKKGDVTVAKALAADKAISADSATKATNATYAAKLTGLSEVSWDSGFRGFRISTKGVYLVMYKQQANDRYDTAVIAVPDLSKAAVGTNLIVPATTASGYTYFFPATFDPNTYCIRITDTRSTPIYVYSKCYKLADL